MKQNLALICLLIIVGFFVYSFNLNNPLFWDDLDWIVNNPFVHSFSWENIKNWFTKDILAGVSQSSNYYRPLLLFTFTLNYLVGGENPLSYHLLSNFLHMANAVLIFLILCWVFKNKFISFWTSLIWLVHPLQTEAVTYISGRGDPLNVFFMLLGLWFFIKNQIRYSAYWLFLIVSLSALAILSRETAVIFPLLLVVFYVSFISQERFIKSLKTAVFKTWPLFIIVLIYGILRLTVLNFENTLNFYSQNNLYTQSFFARMYTFLNVLWTYGRLMIAPMGQHMERSVTIFTYFWNPMTVGSSLVLLLVFWILRRFYKKEIHGSKFSALDSNFRVWFFAVGWFFANLLMTSGITPINAQLYEHWLYLALLGPLVLVILYLKNFYNVSRVAKWVVIMILISVSIFFSTLSIKRNILWGKPIEFFENILKYEPDSARISNNLGTIYYNKGDKEKAAEYYRKAAEATGNLFPQPFFNLGALLQEQGDIRGAIVVFEKAIELDPSFPYPYPNLAVIYASQGDLVKATEYLEKLKELRPDLQRTYYNLALIYIEINDYESAYANLQNGLKYGQPDPDTEPLIQKLLEKFELKN